MDERRMSDLPANPNPGQMSEQEWDDVEVFQLVSEFLKMLEADGYPLFETPAVNIAKDVRLYHPNQLVTATSVKDLTEMVASWVVVRESQLHK